MKKIIKTLRSLSRDSRGATAIEYGLLAALIATAFILGAAALGTSISEVNEDIANEIDDVIATISGAGPAKDDNSGVGDGDGGGKDGNHGND